MFTQLEQFPNELFLHLFIYFPIRDLYRSFWGLNQRLNHLLRSINNLSFIVERDDLALIEIFARQIVRLKINTSQFIDLSRFSNLSFLEIPHATGFQIEQIRADCIPNLVYLSIATPFHISVPLILIEEIFSNAFHLLHQVNLTRLALLPNSFNSQSNSIRILRITCTDANVIPQILLVCPNLSSLHVTFFGENRHILPPSSSNHLLEEFTLHDPYYNLSFETIHILLLYIPNVKNLSLCCRCRRPFVELLDSILNCLEQLNHFECEILESPNDQMIDLEILQQMSECFQYLQCIEKHGRSRYFFTE